MKKRKKNVAFVNKKKKKRLALASLVYAILLSLVSMKLGFGVLEE